MHVPYRIYSDCYTMYAECLFSNSLLEVNIIDKKIFYNITDRFYSNLRLHTSRYPKCNILQQLCKKQINKSRKCIIFILQHPFFRESLTHEADKLYYLSADHVSLIKLIVLHGCSILQGVTLQNKTSIHGNFMS